MNTVSVGSRNPLSNELISCKAYPVFFIVSCFQFLHYKCITCKLATNIFKHRILEDNTRDDVISATLWTLTRDGVNGDSFKKVYKVAYKDTAGQICDICYSLYGFVDGKHSRSDTYPVKIGKEMVKSHWLLTVSQIIINWNNSISPFQCTSFRNTQKENIGVSVLLNLNLNLSLWWNYLFDIYF